MVLLFSLGLTTFWMSCCYQCLIQVALLPDH